MNRYITFLVLINVIWCKASLSDKFQFCSRSDPKINDCLKSAIQNALSALKNGFPDLNIPSLDPIKIPKWTVKAAAPLNFDQAYTNIEMRNHIASEIKEVDSMIGDSEFSLTINFYNPKITYVADYDYQNAILGGVDMSSNGKCIGNATGLSATVNFKGKIKQTDDAEYISVTDAKVNITAESATFTYEAENDEIGKTMTQYYNDNSELIFTKEIPKYARIFGEGYSKNEANSIFSRIPYNILFPK